MLLFDPESGRVTALVGANRITGMRTGAAGAVAVKHLARQDADTVALIGCGAQGTMQLRAVAKVRKLTLARVWDRDPEAASRLANALGSELPFAVEVADGPENAVRGADIVITTTPGEAPVIEDGWVAAGQHVNAIGSDTAGKQEIATRVLTRSRLVVDNRAQAATLGETQHLASIGIEPIGAISAELGEVVAGMAPGRQSATEITVFDATGVTFQDLVVADAVYRRCLERGLGTQVGL
jgi:ornithine cyclodeaminase/alanine dehydrogenase-like protein (mu-crystallin family)